MIKVPTSKHLKFIQDRGLCCVSRNSETELNVAFASSSQVVLIYSVMGSHTFDGYALLSNAVGVIGETPFSPSDYSSSLHQRPVLVKFVRRASIPFSQIAHIRDNAGLGGRPVASAKDGARLGISAGRTLCRSIDKRAYKDDPVYYVDSRFQVNSFPDSIGINTLRATQAETAFLTMSYQEYLDWYKTKRPEEVSPILSYITR